MNIIGLEPPACCKCMCPLFSPQEMFIINNDFVFHAANLFDSVREMSINNDLQTFKHLKGMSYSPSPITL